MVNRVVALGTILLLGAGVASAEVSDKAFETQMEKYLNSEAGQNMVGKAMENYVKKRQEDARKKQDEMAKAQLEEQFKNPVSVDIGKSPVKGPANAKITIVEFSDFQCPFCTKGNSTMSDLMKANPNDIKLVFKHLPLPFHPEAMPAAKASYAAQQQGKFWEMHDALFENQKSLGADFYEATAKKLGLDMDKFKKDMNSEAAEAAVKADMAIAEKNGIQGTPGFFVNGVAVKGAYPQSHFQMIIDRILKKTPAASANG
jgi:protein-disulfide isomerase